MAIEAINFGAGQRTSTSEFAGGFPLASNVIVDAGNAIRRRPGISTWSKFPAAYATGSPVIGMCHWNTYLVWVTADRRIRAITLAGHVTELSDPSIATTLLDGGGKPSFVRGREMLVIAGGGAIQKWAGTGLSSRLLGIDPEEAPEPSPTARHVCGIAQRLVVSRPNQSGQIWWSAPLEEYENWNFATGGASYTQAAAKPDPIVAMADNTNEVFLFGSETLQVYMPSTFEIEGEIVDFSPARTMNIGLAASESVVAVDDMFALLDKHRRFILTDGRSMKELSEPIADILADMDRVEDCWGFRMRFGRWDALVFVFPFEERAFIYDMKLDRWSEWREHSARLQPVSFSSAYRWPEANLSFVGMNDGSLCLLDGYSTRDLGNEIRAELVSGYETHGATVQKWCKALLLQFKRNFSGSGKVRVSKRDDIGQWELIEDIDLGGGTDPSIQLRSLGVYRQRQWKIEYTGGNDLVLASVQEDFEVLGA